MAIEDSACLGLVFGKQFFDGDVRRALQLYEEVRKPRATKVQAASARARENIHERIGKKKFLSLPLEVVANLRTSRVLQQYGQQAIRCAGRE
jgi:salicylate hydroxylase